MGYFEGLSFGWFHNRPDGMVLFAPWRTSGYAYVMTPDDRRLFVRRWGWLTIALWACLVAGQPWRWGVPGWLTLAVVGATVEWVLIRILTHRLVRVRTDGEALVHGPEQALPAARATGAVTLCGLWVASVVFAGGSAWAAAETGRAVFVVGALFFGAGVWGTTRQLVLLRPARAGRGRAV